ncbi:hypothetical protein NHX12_001512 [Muraenolepis orangiensis]|uniref:Uncharacterized protein n=1 Tax=Muraenolepis orangiensis TaxID=630683 RepID=A0A9Q0DZY5_9TELE|nr:hypothetical protein NHX12_001512 [Muraenolepis orangiensis]
MVFRKLPGVWASGMGLRLSQKFLFLLFLSGLITLCFGALFFLPDSVRLKRIFLSKTSSETQPATVGGSENDDAAAANKEAHPKLRAKDPEYTRGMTPTSTKGETTSTKFLRPPPGRKSSPVVTRGAGTEDRPAGVVGGGGAAAEELTISRSRTESASERSTSPKAADPNRSDTFSYATFQRCLLKAPLGTELGRPSDPQTAQRRDSVREEVRFGESCAWTGSEAERSVILPSFTSLCSAMVEQEERAPGTRDGERKREEQRGGARERDGERKREEQRGGARERDGERKREEQRGGARERDGERKREEQRGGARERDGERKREEQRGGARERDGERKREEQRGGARERDGERKREEQRGGARERDGERKREEQRGGARERDGERKREEQRGGARERDGERKREEQRGGARERDGERKREEQRGGARERDGGNWGETEGVGGRAGDTGRKRV